MATKGRFDIGEEVALGCIVRLLDVARLPCVNTAEKQG